MPSEKVKMILLHMSDLSEESIDKMSDGEGWAWIYSNKKPADTREQICFTGFRPAEKKTLCGKVLSSDMKVVTSVTKKLSYLCTGPRAGPKKIEKAKEQKCTILTEEQFNTLIKTGELPTKQGKHYGN